MIFDFFFCKMISSTIKNLKILPYKSKNKIVNYLRIILLIFNGIFNKYF